MQNILMNVEMTKAILDGRKVQTRRVLKDSRIEDIYINENGKKVVLIWGSENYLSKYIEVNSKYQVGETIWVREPAKVVEADEINGTFTYEYLADLQWSRDDIPERFENARWIWNKQGIPNGCIKEMARIFLKITDVRVERLQDISSHDIFAEGIPAKNSCSLQEASADAKEKWIKLWNSTAPNGYKWEDNPYVFVYEFGRVER